MTERRSRYVHDSPSPPVQSESSQLSRRRYAALQRTDFIDALRRARSSQMQALKKAAQSAAARMGFRASLADGLHDSPQGSTPGLAAAIYGNAAPEQVHALASWYGLQGQQPGVAAFHVRPGGSDRLYRMRYHGGGLQLRAKLDRAGIASRILMPHRSGFDIVIPDQGGKLGRTVSQFAKQNRMQLQVSPGFFKAIGSQDKADARADFRNKIVASEQGRARMGRSGKPRRYGRAPEDEVHALASGQSRGYEPLHDVETNHQLQQRAMHDPHNQSDTILADKLADHGDPRETIVRRDLSYRTGGDDGFFDAVRHHTHQIAGGRVGVSDRERTFPISPNSAISVTPYGEDENRNPQAFQVHWQQGPAAYLAAMTPEETTHLLAEMGVRHNYQITPKQLSRKRRFVTCR